MLPCDPYAPAPRSAAFPADARGVVEEGAAGLMF